MGYIFLTCPISRGVVLVWHFHRGQQRGKYIPGDGTCCNTNIDNPTIIWEDVKAYLKPLPFITTDKQQSLRSAAVSYMFRINSLRPRQNGRHFADDIFKWIFLNENVWISIKISLKFVPQCSINNIPALAQIMAWRRPGAKPLSGPMVFRLPTHICVTRPQWVKLDHHNWNDRRLAVQNETGLNASATKKSVWYSTLLLK